MTSKSANNLNIITIKVLLALLVCGTYVWLALLWPRIPELCWTCIKINKLNSQLRLQDFMPECFPISAVWFRFIQAFCIFSLVMDLAGAVIAALYVNEETRGRFYKKRPRMFFISSALMLGSGKCDSYIYAIPKCWKEILVL